MAYSATGVLQIYHEVQVMSLCGVHCLNTLLQSNAFNEVDLSQIAHELDRKEREVMAEGGLSSEDYLKFVAADSQNVSEEGNFSIQVLSEALKVYNISCLPNNHSKISGLKNEPHTQEAFICNLREHWFTVRKIEGVWYNLNSCNAMPEKISEFYLSAFLAQLEAEHYTIFVVVGKLPIPDQSMDVAPSGRWWSLEAMEKEKASQSREANFSDALKNTFQNMQGLLANAGGQMQQALGQVAGTSNSEEGDFEDADLKAAIQESLRANNQSGEISKNAASQQTTSQQENFRQSDESDVVERDRDLARALAASLEEYNNSQDENQSQPQR
jgi:ataxin-3